MLRFVADASSPCCGPFVASELAQESDEDHGGTEPTDSSEQPLEPAQESDEDHGAAEPADSSEQPLNHGENHGIISMITICCS